jgi:hypothetical protein
MYLAGQSVLNPRWERDQLMRSVLVTYPSEPERAGMDQPTPAPVSQDLFFLISE